MSRFALALAAVFLLNAPAIAAPATHDNVIVLKPIEVAVPSELPAYCRVRGKVREVWAGSAYHVGDIISVAVHCSSGQPAMEFADPKASPANIHQPAIFDPAVLRKLPLAAVHLDNSGNLIWTPTARSFGTLAHVVGYRVLDAVTLQISPT